MKKLTLSCLSLLCLSATAFAAPVDRQKASQTAVQYMLGITGKKFTVKQVSTVAGQYHIVNLAPQGWAIIAADDNVRPVLGYNDTGSLSLSTMPSNMRGWLDGRGAIVKQAARDLSQRDAAWSTVGQPRSRATGSDVEPLITVNWNQPAPYNSVVEKNTAKDVLVGCVAVAMSQAMSVQRYPDRPTGTASYTCTYGYLSVNYDAEQPYDWNKILSGADNYAEAARLMYHAGVAVSMNYGTEGSGIPSNEPYRISKALAQYFGYANAQYTWRDNYRSDWEQLLVNDLNAKRAIVYLAVDNKNGYGHAFNIDGYHADDGYFHVNWGWGGVSNGWMAIDNLSEPSMNMYYKDMHIAITGIGAPNRAIFSIDVPTVEVEAGLPAGTVVSQILVNGVNPTAEHTITLEGKFDPATNTRLPVPFKVEAGTDGSTYLVTTRPLTEADSPLNVIVKVKESKTNTDMSSGFVFNIVPQRALDAATSLAYDRASGLFTINTKHAASYTLADPNGTTIASGTLSQLPVIKFNKSQLGNGTNTLTIKWNGKTKSLKIKK